MLCPWLMGIAGRIELVDSDKSRAARHGCALDRLLRHRGNGDVLDLNITLLDLAGDNLRDKVILVVLPSIARRAPGTGSSS